MGKSSFISLLGQPEKLQELQECILASLRGKLSRDLAYLRLARPADVAGLITIQARYTTLAEPVLRQKVQELGAQPRLLVRWARQTIRQIRDKSDSLSYVRDCEQLAELLHPTTSPAAKTIIRQRFWVRYYQWADWLLWARLVAKLGRRKAAVWVAFGQDIVQGIFETSNFDQTATQYKPARGRTFDRFLKRRILFRCAQAIREIAPRLGVRAHEVPMEVPDPDRAFGEHPAACQDGDGQVDPRQQVQTLLECLSRPQSGRRSKLPMEMRTVFELRCKAWLDPDDMAADTKSLLTARSPTAMTLVKDEYHLCQQELKELLEEKLPVAREDHQLAWARAEELENQLASAGYTQLAITELAVQPAARTLEDLEDERRGKPPPPGQPAHRPLELEYMMAFRRKGHALATLQAQQERYTRYRNLDRPWARDQTKISALSGIKPVTVNKRLKAAREFLASQGHILGDQDV